MVSKKCACDAELKLKKLGERPKLKTRREKFRLVFWIRFVRSEVPKTERGADVAFGSEVKGVPEGDVLLRVCLFWYWGN